MPNFANMTVLPLNDVASVPKHDVDLVMFFNGNSAPCEQVILYVLKQYEMKIPIIMFPYNIVKQHSHLFVEQFEILQPLVPGNQSQSEKPNSKNMFFKLVPSHPILQNVSNFECSASIYRSSTKAKQDATVIATWNDDVPLIAERNHVVALNMCVVNLTPSSDAPLIITNTVRYLLNRWRCKNAYKFSQRYADVRFEW